MPIRSNIINERFGKLTVIKRSDKRGPNGGYWYLCQCDCGNTKLVNISNLRPGVIKSCGCAYLGNQNGRKRKS